MGKRRVTIQDVANRAGVAISSVSRVLSGHLDVSERMRSKVESVVEELGYAPDHLAQALRKGTTRTIGFIIRDITNPLFSIVAQSAEYELRKSGYSMILINSDGDEQTENENFLLFKNRRVDGVIASLVSEDAPDVRHTIDELGIPIVLLDREVNRLNASAVICDHRSGVAEATQSLIALGHTKIGFISGRADIFITRNRLKGIEDAFTANFLQMDMDLVRLGKFGDEYAYKQTLDLLSLINPPTAIIAGGINASSGVLQALKELKLVPGEGIALIALDEWPMFDVLTSHISSVYRDPEEMGKQSARLILELINDGVPSQTVIPTIYRERTSTCMVKNA